MKADLSLGDDAITTIGLPAAQPRNVIVKALLLAVRRDLDEITEQLTPDMLDWAPRHGMRTIAGQLVEIAATEMQLMTLLREDRWIDDPEALELLGGDDDLQRLLQATVTIRKDTLDYLGSLSETDLAEEVEFGGGWFGSLGLPVIPRAEIFVHVADHEWYHVGQLTSYLWFRGIDPYGKPMATPNPD